MTVLQLSWSGLRRWEECRHKHKLAISGKIPKGQDGRVFLPGTVSDRIMRAWLEQPDGTHKPGDMVAMVEEYFNRSTNDGEYVIRWRSGNDRAITMNFVREVVTGLEPILFEHVLPFDYQPELRFKTPIYIPYLDGTPVRIELVGGIDIVVRKPGQLHYLHDLKATKDPAYAKKVIGQMIFYDIAFNALTKHQPVYSGLIMPACKQAVVPIEVTDAMRRDMMSRIIGMAHGIWRKEFPLAETRAPCQFCDAKPVCPRYATPVDRNEDGTYSVSFASVAAQRAQSEQELFVEPSPIDLTLGEVMATNEPPFGRADNVLSFDRKV